MQELKCVIVGNDGIGKTSLFIRHYARFFSPDHRHPTLIDEGPKTVMVNGEPVLMEVLDMEEEYMDDDLLGYVMRPRSYPGTDVFLICFSMDRPDSYEDVYFKWYPEVQKYCPNTPIVVVGLSRDCCNDKSVISELRTDDPGDPCAPLTSADGWRLAKDIGAVKYVECTSFNQETVDNVFREAA